MLGLKLNHVSKRGPKFHWWYSWNTGGSTCATFGNWMYFCRRLAVQHHGSFQWKCPLQYFSIGCADHDSWAEIAHRFIQIIHSQRKINSSLFKRMWNKRSPLFSMMTTDAPLYVNSTDNKIGSMEYDVSQLVSWKMGSVQYTDIT